MKTKVLLIISFLLVIFSLYNIKSSFSSDKAIYYNAQTKKITYFNIDNQDFFSNFKNLIPGDIREETIKINVVNAKEDVIMYLKMNFEDNRDIIDNVNIRVYIDDTEIIKTGEMFKIIDGNKESVELKLVIEVPTTLENEIANYNENFKISFLVEDHNDLVEVPKTYDSNIYIYYVILFVSLILLIITITMLLKKENKKEI